MEHYYVNKNADHQGNHEVHIPSCGHFPNAENRVYVGYFSNCTDAVNKAKETYPTADGCKHCIPTCHTE